MDHDIIEYNELFDKLMRLQMHYHTYKDSDIKYFIYDEILQTKYKLKKLEEKICANIQHHDFDAALDMLERIKD